MKKYLQRQWKCSCITSPHAFHFSTPGPHPMLSKKLSIFAGGTKVSVVSSCRQHWMGSGGWKILDGKKNFPYYIKKKLSLFPRSGCVFERKHFFFLEDIAFLIWPIRPSKRYKNVDFSKKNSKMTTSSRNFAESCKRFKIDKISSLKSARDLFSRF